MAKNVEKIRFAADSNVLGLLALAAKSERKFFYHYPKVSREVYEGLAWMNNMITAGKIELVLPYVVFHELIKNKAEPLTTQKNMTPQQLANFEHKRYFKIIAKTYIRNNPNIKIAFMEGGLIKKYGQKVVALAKEYSEQAKYPNDIIRSHEEKQKPFIMTGEFPYNDSRIMAEATLMGFNLITFDKHFLNKTPYNVPNGIWRINMNKFDSPVRPVSFLSLIRAMKREGTDKPYLKRTFKNQTFPSFVNYELLSHEEYGIRVEQTLASKKEYYLGLEDIANTRTLFLKYMQNPLSLEELKFETLQEEIQIEEKPLQATIQAEETAPVIPAEPKKEKPAPQVPTAPKKKIKFNLSGGQDFDGLAAFLNNQKDDKGLDH